jgi:hypothetical protein
MGWTRRVGIGALRRGAGRKRRQAGRYDGVMRADRGAGSLVGKSLSAGHRPRSRLVLPAPSQSNVVQSGGAAEVATRSYLINLLGEDYLPLASETFEASDDAEAVTIACALGDTCADVARGCELWRGNELVTALGFSVPSRAVQFELARIQSDLQMQPRMRQATIITLQEAFLRLHPCMRASRLLVGVAEDRIRHQ